VRRASVNNFGYGGTNAHVIMEEYRAVEEKPATERDGEALSSQVLVLSAKEKPALQQMINNMAEYLRHSKECDLDVLKDITFTLGQHRSRFQWAAAYPVSSKSSLIEALEGSQLIPSRSTGAPRLGFVFTGQGAQWYAMGRELIASYPIFQEALIEAEGHLRGFGATWSLIGKYHLSWLHKPLTAR